MGTWTTKLDFLSYKLASNHETFGMTFGDTTRMLHFSSSSSEMMAIFDRWRKLLLAAQSWPFDRSRRRHPIRFQDERRYQSRDNGSAEAGVAESFRI